VKSREMHTIIGNSAAGLAAIKAIRKMGDRSPITLISAEPCNAYSPVLTPYYISGQIKRAGLFVVEDKFYRKFNIQVLFGRKAVAIDTEKRLVHLKDRTRVPFKKLLIATGASARSLDNVEKNASGRVFTLRTIADAEKIKAVSEKARNIVLIGAGLVSLQTIKAILGAEKSITLVVGSYQVLSQQMDSGAANIIQKRLEHEGITILFGRRVERIIRKGDQVLVATSFGESLPADMVIVGKGVNPNIEVVENTDVKTNVGILVDNQMRTSVEDVYAAGDVAEGRNTITGNTETIATWFSACAQGEIAGMNMAGTPAKIHMHYRENITTILGLSAATMGMTAFKDWKVGGLTYSEEKKNVYRRLIMDGPRLVGAILLGKTEDAGVIRHCITNKIDISSWEKEIARGSFGFGNTLFSKDFSWPVH
jgi:nitrite reductase (NADH) large subunit